MAKVASAIIPSIRAATIPELSPNRSLNGFQPAAPVWTAPMTAHRLLFRQEAIDFQRHHRQWGNVGALQPLSTKVTTWFLTGITALLAVFLFFAQYSRKETAVGYLTPTRGTA